MSRTLGLGGGGGGGPGIWFGFKTSTAGSMPLPPAGGFVGRPDRIVLPVPGRGEDVISGGGRSIEASWRRQGVNVKGVS